MATCSCWFDGLDDGCLEKMCGWRVSESFDSVEGLERLESFDSVH